MMSIIHPPLIEDFEVYRNFIGALARATTEGFNKEAIKKWADSIGDRLDPMARSLGALKACLQHLSTPGIAQQIHQPLHELHREKSAISSHGGKRSDTDQSLIQAAVDWLGKITEAVEMLSKIVIKHNRSILSAQEPHHLTFCARTCLLTNEGCG